MVQTLEGRLLITETALRINSENNVILFYICEICFKFTDEDIQLSLSVFNIYLWCKFVQHQSQNKDWQRANNKQACVL